MLVAPARRSLLIVEVAQWGHGARSATGVDLGTVFVVGDIADLVQAGFRCQCPRTHPASSAAVAWSAVRLVTA
jgi:hypothetical protein